MNTPYDRAPRYGVYIVSPCKDCADRYPACHSDCAAYGLWKIRYAEGKAALAAQLDANVQAKFSLRRHGIAVRSDQV